MSVSGVATGPVGGFVGVSPTGPDVPRESRERVPDRSLGRGTMRLRLLGTSSGHAGCPALYATDRDTYVVQGKLVTDPEAISHLVDVREDEFYVEIPRLLLRFAESDGDC
jgi:hypothetical protein